MQNFNGSPKWIAGRVIANRAPLSVTIQLDNGTKVNRHVDHVRLHGMEGEKNASLVTQEMGNSDEEADDDLLPPVAPEQDLKAPAVAADQQELPPPPPVMEEVPPLAAVTNAPAPH